MEGMKSGSQDWESGLHKVLPWFLAHSSPPQHKADLHSDPNITEVEEEEEGGTAEQQIANTAQQASQDLHKYVVDKGEANWSTLHDLYMISYLEKPQDVQWM